MGDGTTYAVRVYQTEVYKGALERVLAGKLPTLVKLMVDAPDVWLPRWRQPSGNGGCHHDGVACTSMRSTHLTHQ
jgi:hypothetical protein